MTRCDRSFIETLVLRSVGEETRVRSGTIIVESGSGDTIETFARGTKVRTEVEQIKDVFGWCEDESSKIKKG